MVLDMGNMGLGKNRGERNSQGINMESCHILILLCDWPASASKQFETFILCMGTRKLLQYIIPHSHCLSSGVALLVQP